MAVKETVDNFCNRLGPHIQRKYHEYLNLYHAHLYPQSKCPCREIFKKNGFHQLHFDLYSLNIAIDEILQDIKFIIDRRGPLIAKDDGGNSLISHGKVAGVITFRLSRRQIVHVDEVCLDFKRCQIRCTAKMNTEFALLCGAEFIQAQFNELNEFIQRELFYQLTTRHVNQETLGLIFDTIRLYQPPA
jgi:hypothetical protein